MGLIHLYSATSTSFDNNGTPLVTAREAVVKRDEGFQLTFSIPISQNELHKRVQKEMIVSAMTPDGVNYFRIWDIEKRTTDVKVTALQLLYSLDVKQINPFGGERHTGDSVLQAFVSSFKSSISPYTFSSSIITQREFHTNEEDDTSTSHNALAILNKITDTWSGELMLNGFDVRMISKLGTKTDALLYEHKNIASFSDSSSMNGIVTRIYATATYTPERAEGATEDPEPVVLTATVDSPLIDQYAVIYEATMEYNDARTVDELRTEILKQYSEFNVDKPERTIDVDTNIVDGTAINFGDELVLKYLVHDVDEVIRCVGYEYDPISENYIGVTLGTLEKTFLTKVSEGISSSVSRQFDKLNRDIQGIATAANGRNRIAYGPSPVPNAIEGDLWFYHPAGRPDEVELLVYQNGLWVPAPFLTDQDRAEFDQAMTEHYNNAIAEIERKDAEYKEIFDDYDETVATMDQAISDAATKAQSALEEAGISTDLAQTAKDLADTAKADASTAISSANQAKEDAQTAITNASTAATDANQAKEDAQTAITEAGQAVESANTAKTNAQTALTDAQTALSTANNADTKSGLAETAANTAKTNAQTALDNSNTAITNAADAITKAGQAETAANTAKTNAQTALDDAQSALTTAGSADSKAGQAIAKANAIPTTITDIIADKNLVNGTYVDTKVNAATGAWSQELVRVEGKLDGLDIGGRNYFVDRLMLDVDNYERIGSYYYYTINNLSPEEVYTVSVREDYTNDISIGSGPNRALRINNDKTDSLGMDIIDVRLSNGIRTYEREIRANEDGQLFIISYIPSLLDEIHNMIKIEKGNIATDWTPAPEDLYSQEEFKIFNAQYTQDVTGITGRLTTVETDKLDGSTFQTFKQAEYQVTADKVASTITRVDTAEGKITTQGTAISQQATAIASKADKTVVDTLAGTVSTQGTSISQNATDISSKADSELVDDIKGTVDTHTTEISQNATDIASKASSTSVNALTGRVSTAETTISQHATAITSKASQTEVDTVKGTVSSHTTTLGQHATAISSKAESSLVDTIKDTVDTHTTDISQNATDIASKASSTSVNALTGRVSTAESNISQNATAITQRVTTATYNTGIASKENTVLKQSTAPAHVNGRLWLDTSVTPNILKRSTGSAWVKATPTTPGEVGAYSQSAGAGLAGRLTTAETTITQTATAIESKADQTEVDTVKGTVSGHTTTLSQHATAIASKAESSLVNTIKGTVDTHTTEIGQNATDIASKASSSSVNTLTGRVSTAESNIGQNATAISQRVTTTTYNTGIASKENSVLKQSAAPSHLNGRLWLDTSVTPNVLKRSTGSAWVKATPTTAAEVGAYSSSQGSTLAGRVTTAETNITQTATAIESKADQTEVDTVKGTVSGHTTTLSQHATAIASKAESSLVNTIKGTVDTHTTEISQNATAIASKASSSSVSTLTGRVSTAETTITQHATAIASKASQTEVDTVKGTVSGHTSTLSQHASQISARLTTSQVNSLVDGKGLAKVAYVDNQITATATGIRTDITKVEGKIDGLQVGGRNLLKETSNLEITSTTQREYFITKPLELGAHVISFYAKANTNASARVYINDNTGAYRFAGTNADITLTTEMKKYVVPIEVTRFNGSEINNISLRIRSVDIVITDKEMKLEKGNIATDWSPAPEDTMMENDFTVFKGEYEATAESLSSRLTAIDKVGGRLSTAESNITQNATAISSKANTITVNTLTGRVSTAETKITQNATAISSKANTSTVNTLTGRVSTAESNISQNATAISARLTTSQVNSLVDGKGLATATYVNTQITATADGINADMTRVEGKIDNLQVGGTNLIVRSKEATNKVISTTGDIATNIDNSLAPDIPIEVGKDYTFTKTSSGITENYFRYGWYRANGTLISRNANTANMFTVKAPANAAILKVSYPTVSRVQVEKGNKATDWSPAPEDTVMDNDFTVFKNSYNSTVEGIDTNLSRVDSMAATGVETQNILNINRFRRLVTDSFTIDGTNKTVTFVGSTSGTSIRYEVSKGELEEGTWYTFSFNLNTPSGNRFHIDVSEKRDSNPNSYQPPGQGITGSYEIPFKYESYLTNDWGFIDFNFNSGAYFQISNIKLNKGPSKSQDLVTSTQFQSVKETADRYTRVIGSTDAQSRTKIAQIAMTDSLFQTTVSSMTGGGVNRYSKNTPIHVGAGLVAVDRNHYNAPNGFRVTGASSGVRQLRVQNIIDDNGWWTVSGWYRGEQGTNIHFIIDIADGAGSEPFFTGTNNEWLYFEHSYNVHNYSKDAYHFIDLNFSSWAYYLFKDFKVEKGSRASGWSLAPEDTATQTQVTQLANSWVMGIKSGTDIVTQISATPAGVRIKGNSIHLDGNTLIDTAVIKSAHIENLNANKITGNTAEFNTIRTGVLTANAVEAKHIYADTAFFDKLFSTTSATNRLSAQEAWIKSANIINLNADKITAGTIRTQLIGRNYARRTSYIASTPHRNNDHQFARPLDLGVYTLTFYAKANTATSAQVYLNDDNGAGRITGTCTPNIINIGTGWTKYTVQVNVSKFDRNNYNRLFIRVYGRETTSMISTSELMFTKGYVAMDYIPAPEDNPTDKDLRTYGSVTIHGGNITASTIDVGKITGDTATFISAGFKSLNSQATINGHAIRIQNTAGEFVEMNNVPELRSDDAGGTAVVLGKGRVHFYDSRGYSKGYVGTDMHTAGSYDFGTFLSKGSGIYKFARMADATQTTYAYYTVKAGLTAPASVITNMVQNGYLPDGNPQQFVAKGNMLSQLNGWPAYPNWPTLTAGQQIRYKELTSQTTGDAYEDIWKFGPSSQGDWRIYFAKHATFEGGTTGTSDRRLKHDIEPTQIEALGHIESLAFKEFKWNRDNKYEPLGLIAQDSGIVRVADDDMEGIDIQRAIMLGLKGIQELQEIVKEQAEEIRQLKEINNQ